MSLCVFWMLSPLAPQWWQWLPQCHEGWGIKSLTLSPRGLKCVCHPGAEPSQKSVIQQRKVSTSRFIPSCLAYWFSTLWIEGIKKKNLISENQGSDERMFTVQRNWRGDVFQTRKCNWDVSFSSSDPARLPLLPNPGFCSSKTKDFFL